MELVEGEGDVRDEVRSVGTYLLEGDHTLGGDRVDLVVDVDADGAVRVGVQDADTSFVRTSGQIEAEAMKRFTTDAQRLSRASQPGLAVRYARLRLDSFIRNLARSVGESWNYDEAFEGLFGEVQGSLDSATEMLRGEDVKAMKESARALAKLSHKVAEARTAHAQKVAQAAREAAEAGDEGSDDGE